MNGNNVVSEIDPKVVPMRFVIIISHTDSPVVCNITEM